MTTSELSKNRQPASGAPQEDTGLGYLVPVWTLVIVFGAVMLFWSHHVGIPLRDPHGSIFWSRIGISLGLFVPLSLLDAAIRVGRRGLSVGSTWEMWRRRWPRRKLVLAFLAFLAYHLVYFTYHNLKSWDVLNAPKDDMLLRWDRWMFLGHSPAVLLHDLLGQNVAHYVLMITYESFSTLVMISVVAAVAFNDRIRDGYVFIASGLWVWSLGLASYYAIPSLGPFDSARQEFTGLPHTMIQDTQARYMGQRAHLLAHPQASDAFAQVSAFASLHVGVTGLIFLMARYYGLRRISRALGVFLFGTVIATVYLGWHFFVDDIAGAAIALLSVYLGSRMIYPHGRPARKAAHSESVSGPHPA